MNSSSILYTDCWKGYSDAKNHVSEHKTVNHSQCFVSNENVHTNTIEGNWAAVKTLIPKRYRSKKFLSAWLHYFMFQRNLDGESVLNFIKILE
ncbi:hypothetical protein COBT_003219 [Conglomerata obtusa]